MAKAWDVVGYAYDADVHCVDCTLKRFSAESLDKHYDDPECAHDSEGNPVSPIFELSEECYTDVCGDCFQPLFPEYHESEED